jgi:II/X family phage/plasmid replication protein
MIDLFAIQLPIKTKFIHTIDDVTTGKISGATFDLDIAMQFGFKIGCGQVERDDAGLSVTNLFHSYESLASSNSTLSFKIFKGDRNYFPFIEIKASPAKLLQGHNVYGSDDVKLCSDALLYSFVHAFPQSLELVDYPLATIKQIDCTYTAHVKNEFTAKQLIELLKNVSHGHLRTSNKSYHSSVMWNAGSSHVVREVYLKEFEVQHQIKNLEKRIKKGDKLAAHQIEKLKNPDVMAFMRNAVRFEAKIKNRKLQSMGVPTLLTKFIEYNETMKLSGKNMIAELWKHNFNDIFATFEGLSMNIYDDNKILNELKGLYHKELKASPIGEPRYSYAKANRIFGMFRRIKNEGFNEVKETTDKSTFSRLLSDLSVVVPKIALMNCDSHTSNIIPLVQVINIDFDNQVPSSYQEPLGMDIQLTA